MFVLRRGTIRLFSVSGIEVFLHWSWFVVAAFEIGSRASSYSSPGWNIAEYLTLFLIVMLHEFGHALACRQVGGTADRIVLWPLGGVAYVNPPMRPGAVLWSIVAGPLVNVALIPVLAILVGLSKSMGWAQEMPNAYLFLRTVLAIDLGLLAFNVLPIYPLDGGKIVWSLLWYPMGRARSLMAATVVGFLGSAGLVVLAITSHSSWLGILCVFFVLRCWSGLQAALAMVRLETAPRRAGRICPSCKASPPIGAHWACPKCKTRFDTFATNAVCPSCGSAFGATACVDCKRSNRIGHWSPGAMATPEPEPVAVPQFSD
jgi:Zn-dependent protease